jgi:hypothetical protein
MVLHHRAFYIPTSILPLKISAEEMKNVACMSAKTFLSAFAQADSCEDDEQQAMVEKILGFLFYSNGCVERPPGNSLSIYISINILFAAVHNLHRHSFLFIRGNCYSFTSALYVGHRHPWLEN